MVDKDPTIGMRIAMAAAQINAPGLLSTERELLTDKNPAEWTYDRLLEYFRDFEKTLDQNHEVGVRLVSFGGNTTFHIVEIGYYGPDIITFYGVDSKNHSVQLIQNISQLSVLLIAVEKRGEKPVRIGFIPESPKEKS